ncbi:hypothetical protein FHL15_010582 [Xylaria flabelliformis]|uniref:Uncharacterized protein n=1 Tax=Xylaria flabelliformis TaxID=2512241 RepID=A0A553HKS0_9PEZI|nr:hypothetical protein FHL15_010582 [Xylaria flabelliformis]
MGWERGIEMALQCHDLLQDHGIAIEVEVREGTSQRSAISANLENHIDETFWPRGEKVLSILGFEPRSANTIIAPMLSHVGYPVKYLKDHFGYGTMGLHVVLGDDSKVYGLTCRHVVDSGHPQRDVLGLPCQPVAVLRGQVTIAQVESQRPSYINALYGACHTKLPNLSSTPEFGINAANILFIRELQAVMAGNTTLEWTKMRCNWVVATYSGNLQRDITLTSQSLPKEMERMNRTSVPPVELENPYEPNVKEKEVYYYDRSGNLSWWTERALFRASKSQQAIYLREIERSLRWPATLPPTLNKYRDSKDGTRSPKNLFIVAKRSRIQSYNWRDKHNPQTMAKNSFCR